MRKGNSQTDSLRKLLRKHRLHEGVYLRVAKRLGVDPSYVSKVAGGKIVSVEIYRALLKELERIERMWRKKNARSPVSGERATHKEGYGD